MVRILLRSIVPAIASAIFVGPACAAEEAPAWAYPVNPPDFKLAADDGAVRRVPDSSAGYTLTQTRDRFAATDWHPEDHGPMPEVVARGRKPDVFACGWCHRADGPGGPENANLAGLPAAYIVQQMVDFKSGARRTAVPKRAPTALMLSLAKAISDDDVAEAARYFAAQKPRRSLRVVETDQVPKTIVTGWILADAGTGEKEPIGARIIEVPVDLEHFESRDSRAHFVAYVPSGSLRAGEALVTTGLAGKTIPCVTCHGADLRGIGLVPPIAGRSPSYIARQLYDIRSGARAGAGAAQMRPVVEKLDLDDMRAIAAYVAAQAP